MKAVSYRGNAINDGTNYSAGVLMPALGLPRVNVRQVDRLGRWPSASGIERRGRTVVLSIVIEKSDWDDGQAELASWFDPEDETAGQLIVSDNDDSNQRYWMAICEELVEEDGSPGNEFLAVMVIDGDPRLRGVTAAQDIWSVGGTGQQEIIANDGADDAYPILTIEPTSSKTGGYDYRMPVFLRWRVDEGVENYPVDVADDSLDTATLVSGGKMQADGDDLRVLINGVAVNRWLDGINTSTTKVWVNLDFSPRAEATLEAAIAGSGSVDTIDVNEDISKFPSYGALVVGSECFVYTSKNNALRRFLGVTRAARGTSMGAHSADATIWWVQHDIALLYGNSSADAPDVDDDYKPMFLLASSTNTSWDYSADFGEDDGLRTGAWVMQESRAQPPTLVEFYTDQQYTFNDPWESLGVRVYNIRQSLTEELGRWAIYNPCGITNFDAANGYKWIDTDASNFQAELQSSINGSKWVTEYTVPAPSTSDTWESWNQDQAIDSGSKWVGLMLRVPLFTGSIDDRRVECYEGTLTLNSSNTPAITLGSEVGNYSLACTITNNTTGDALSIDFVMGLNEELEVDTDEKTVTYLEDGSSQFQALALEGAARRDWLRLAPGNNTWQFDDVGTNTVTVTVDFEERYYQ